MDILKDTFALRCYIGPIGGSSVSPINRRLLRLSMPVRQRADAARNRARLVGVARSLFSRSTKPVTLEAIALSAGVGIGTLYRHFPTKEALVDAVYRAELDALDHEADALLASGDAFGAMRHWLDLYASFVATKHAMHDALRIALTPGSKPLAETRVRMNETIVKFLSAGCRDRSMRDGLEADDVTLAFAGAVFAATTTPDREQIRRILDLLMAGLRP